MILVIPFLEGVLYTVCARCVYWGDFVDLPTYSRVKCMFFPGCKRHYRCTYCTLSLCSITHVSLMASCGHHYHQHPIQRS